MSLSPAAWARIVPFALFMLLLALRGAIPETNAWGVDPRWIYGLNLLVVGGALAWYWRGYGELSRQNRPTLREVGLSVIAGLVVFGLWISLDAPWMRLGEATAAFVPTTPDGRVDWPLIAIRWIGAALLVPVMEELFWRSFLMRWIASPQFETVDPRQVGGRAVMISTFVFMLAHTLWLAAIVAGAAYALLYRWTGKLWCAVIAHAVTNGVLGIWVVYSGRWEFW
ncbi:CAAX prenyl protease-related protein [Roseateles aquatilis]|uniref:CAAX prenyl protease-related protein n=1 Tax=Roseateles aquatilis TaxID=431061 RepID=A0A246ITX6_9BURK|nr:CAAX prenyl protease-related protein [Roseateles aquatilis]OWQ83209.1 CAAX prenyl protease-related protein [Roseateles aquatilis]